MRVTAILLCIFCLNITINSYSQKITLKARNITLKEVFDKLENQSSYFFTCTNDLINKVGKINVAIEDLDIKVALNKIFTGTGLMYRIDGNYIIVSEKKTDKAREEERIIKINGQVTSSDGGLLAGATIKVKGKNTTTVADEQGRFSIEAEKGGVLIVSNIGYESREVIITTDEIIAVVLIKKVSAMEEVVVNKGYYMESKRLTTGSVTGITAADIQKQPVSNPIAALQGRISGLIVTQNTGVPGGRFTVQIRGRNSINSANEPFYIVDGVPFVSSSLSLGNTLNMATIVDGGNPLNNINPADIESIEILKDADALSIYGSRGANGAILITTKKGIAGKTKLDVNIYQGTAKVSRFMDLLNTEQYLEMRREAFANDGITITPTTPNTNDLKWDNTRYTNWQKVLIGGSAKYTDAQLSVSGGTSNTKFVVGGGLHRETTVFPGDFSDTKASAHFNITHTSHDAKLKLIFTGTYLDDNNNLLRIDFTNAALIMAPNAPALYQPNGELNWENSTWSNPFAEIRRKYKGRTGNLIGNVNISYELLRNLRAAISMGYNSMSIQELNTLPLSSYDPAIVSASTNSDFSNNSIKSWIIEPGLEYKIDFGKIKLQFLAGGTLQQNLRTGDYLSGNGYTNDALLEDIKSASTVTVYSSTYSKYRYIAAFGRANLNYDNRYVLNFTGRRDGSSRFGPGKQFANFSAVGVAWIFSNESFIQKNLPFISYGKLRSSFGTSGSDQISDYKFLDLWSAATNEYMGIKGLIGNNLFNPDYAWEENKKLEIGINLGFLNDRINLAANYYRNRSDNQLVGNPLPLMTGFSTITANLNATVDNTGWEFELNSPVIRKKILSWSINFNITLPESKLVKYPDFDKSTTAPLVYTIGYPLNVAKLYPYAGIDPATGTYLFRTASGNAVVSPSFITDRTLSLSLLPDFYGGFQNKLEYKHLSLDFLVQIVKQEGINYLGGFQSAPGFQGNQSVEVMKRWRKPEDKTNIQKFTQSTTSNVYRAYSSSFLSGEIKYSDASYIRLKNVSVSYQLPSTLIDKIKAQHVKIYLQGQNLFTITQYKGLDPETQSFRSLPVLRVITAGIQLVF